MRAAALALATAALLAPGCPGVARPLERPIVEPRAEVALGASGEPVIVELALHVVNPNGTALELRAVDWELLVDERPVARGRETRAEPLPARAARAVALVAQVGAGQSEWIREVEAGSGAAATVRGTLHFGSPRGPVAATFVVDVGYNRSP